MTTPAAALGRHLRGLREQAGLTQREVADRMGAVPSLVNKLENHGKDPQMSTVLRYCSAIGARVHIGFPTKEDHHG